MIPNQKKPEPESPVPEESERSSFARFAKKLLNVPKKGIDEKAREWESPRSARSTQERQGRLGPWAEVGSNAEKQSGDSHRPLKNVRISRAWKGQR